MGRRARTIAVIKNKDSGGKAMTGQGSICSISR